MRNLAILDGRVIEPAPRRMGAAVTVRMETWYRDMNGDLRYDKHFVECFRHLEEQALRLKPGDLVSVTGRYRVSKYEKHGKTRFFSSVKAASIEPLGGITPEEENIGARPTSAVQPAPVVGYMNLDTLLDRVSEDANPDENERAGYTPVPEGQHGLFNF